MAVINTYPTNSSVTSSDQYLTYDSDGTVTLTPASTAVPAGTITNSKLSTTAGELGGAWTSWTPTFTNLSGGTLNYALFQQVGKTVRFRLAYTLGGAGVSGSVSFTLPASYNSTYAAQTTIGSGNAQKGAGGYQNLEVVPLPSDVTKAIIYARNAAGTYSTDVALSSTVPITWASGDAFAIQGEYESA